MIHVRQVSKSFGAVQAVRAISFEVRKGQCVGLLGPNGAGKTTTLRMITGFVPPSSGTISIAGHDTIGESARARRVIGYLPESTPLFPEMRVRDFLLYRAALYGASGRGAREAVERVMGLCRVSDVAARRTGQLSKGYKQRVGLAGALVHDPPVLILDEPTSGLDPSQIRETRSLIRDLAANRTVIVSSHILPEIEKTCDRVIIMARGSVRADGSPEELVRSLDHQGRYIVEASSEGAGADRLERAIGTIAGVARVETLVSGDAGWVRLSVTAGPGAADLREAIGREAAQARVPVRELTRVIPSLEQVFMRVIEEDVARERGAAERRPAPQPETAAA